jgi:hypothetical protein
MAVDEENSGYRDDISTDALAEILRRIPPNSRRRSRLVCRHWRDIVHERTPTSLRSRAQTLLLIKGVASVLDDKWRVKPLTLRATADADPTSSAGTGDTDANVLDDKWRVVGTCNGLICLCDGSQPGGAITLTNPSNGETLVLPPLPCADSFMRGRSR